MCGLCNVVLENYSVHPLGLVLSAQGPVILQQ